VPLRVGLTNIGVTAGEDHVVLRFPLGVNVGDSMTKLGARAIAGATNNDYALQLPKPEQDVTPLFVTLIDLDIKMPSPRPGPREAVPSPHPGIAVYRQGDTLRLAVARVIEPDVLVQRLQPTHDIPCREHIIRTDIHAPETIAKTVDTLARACASITVPPTSPHNGVNISPELAAAVTGTKPHTFVSHQELERAQMQINIHFGAGRSIHEHPAAAHLPKPTQNLIAAIQTAPSPLSPDRHMGPMRSGFLR
jgi:hypothetical protein